MKAIRIEKRSILIPCIAVLLLLGFNQYATAQEKTGYVNVNEIVYSMPDMKTIQTQVDAFQKPLIDQLTSMNNELQTKAQAFESQKAAMTDAIKTVKETELTDIQKRMSDFETTARQQVAQKSNDLMKPVVDKVMLAITAVAKEKGYHMILDAASSNIVGKSILYAPDADDVTVAVKTKLGITK